MNLDLIIPTYNRSDLLLKCLDSVCRATRPPGMNIRVVVVDNNSKDNTREVVKPFLEIPDLNFQYVFVERAGKSAALNDALAQTHAEIVGMIDDDEQMDPAWFEVAHRELSSDPTLEYIGGPYYPQWEIPLPDYLPPVTTYGSDLGIILRPKRIQFSSTSGILMGGNIAIRRATLEKVLPYS